MATRSSCSGVGTDITSDVLEGGMTAPSPSSGFISDLDSVTPMPSETSTTASDNLPELVIDDKDGSSVSDNELPDLVSDDKTDSLEDKGDTKSYQLTHVKHDYIEKDETFVVHLYIKEVDKSSCKIEFEDKLITVNFKTCLDFFHFQKPTAKVSPMNKNVMDIERVTTPGFTGLDNLGNTCFMNSVLQALSNSREFRDFFLSNLFLLQNLIAMKASQFTGFAQHDSQEFMAFLLDGLHEVVASEAWEVYKKRNDSFIVDLFQGQYKSKLVCPVCGKVSITFDPFLYLSVPLPKKKRVIPIRFMWKDPYKKPILLRLRLAKDATTETLKESAAKKTGVSPKDPPVKNEGSKLISQSSTSSNLSSSSQSSGSMSSLDSQSSCSSTCTIVADQDKEKENDVEATDDGSGSGSSLEALAGSGDSNSSMNGAYGCGDGSYSATNMPPYIVDSDVQLGEEDHDYGERNLPENRTFKMPPVDTLRPSMSTYKDNNASCREDESESVLMDNDKLSSKTIPTKSVLGIQKGDADRITPLFFIKPVNQDGAGLKGPEGERLDDKVKWKFLPFYVMQVSQIMYMYLTYCTIDKTLVLIKMFFLYRGLDLSPYFSGSGPHDAQLPIYDLYAVVNHYGGILGGHYTSFVRCADLIDSRRNEVGWRLCDDSRVTTILNENSVVTRGAYLLFYRRRTPFVPPKPLPQEEEKDSVEQEESSPVLNTNSNNSESDTAEKDRRIPTSENIDSNTNISIQNIDTTVEKEVDTDETEETPLLGNSSSKYITDHLVGSRKYDKAQEEEDSTDEDEESDTQYVRTQVTTDIGYTDMDAVD
ncbi:hypothetical protein KUTeg_020147 [Tegillarca granosa]|uniref:Ubiquitin carboxyl-terminal hydrolase n=1 Tax=Tegillarca granosa TaxID=220873 RepID=A0ABQ9E7M5_TEGGR|nr:hypothetical protein KUTeg_020147 [Tegillarca granosa]